MSFLKIFLNKLVASKMFVSQRFVITKLNQFDWEGRIDNKLICEFNYLKDNQGYWINYMCTNEEYRNKGYGFGTKMIEAAINEYGKILVNNLSRLEFNAKKHSIENYTFETNRSDTRYPMDDALMKFINKCIDKKIVKKEWVLSPFG